MTTDFPRVIGPYRVEREIARGGMGVVYLARDTRLDRTVALKALPPEVASDPERLQRFEREAKLLASLNHPNIGAIYDVAESAGRRYLALEHIEGESLAQKLSGRALPISEALETCLQIASGLEAAHERGVIHRDLKPGNVMITPGDQVKIVDFGLAKGAEVEGSTAMDTPVATASSPTLTSPAYSPGTIPGVILGTAPYLSPEQARGKPADRRTDIWSWGCVLYESLTGRMAFSGETVSDTVSAILTREPDSSALPGATPPQVRRLLRRCLEKDPKRRLRDIGEARYALEEIKAGRPDAPEPSVGAEGSRRLLGALIFGIGLILGVVIALALLGNMRWGRLGRSQARAEPINLTLPIPPDVRALDADITADGRILVMRGVPRAPEGAPPRIYRRLLSHTGFDPISGTEGATDFVLSPDGTWIGYVAPITERATQHRVYKVPVDGSAPPVAICDYQKTWSGSPLWLESDDLLVATDDGLSFVRVSGKTGQVTEPRAAHMTDANVEISFDGSIALPGDRGALVRAISYHEGAWQIGIGLLDLRTGAARMLIHNAGSPHFAPTGHLLFTRGAILFAVRFDPKRLETVGSPVALQGGLRAAPYGHATFDLAQNGVLVQSLGTGPSGNRKILVLDRAGNSSDWSTERRNFEDVSASRDGRALFVVGTTKPLFEIWLGRAGNLSRRLVAVPGVDCWKPSWSPDCSRIAFIQSSGGKDDGIYVASLAGAPRLLCRVPPDQQLQPKAWSSGGSKLLCVLVRPGNDQLVTVEVGPEGSPPVTPRVLLGGSATYSWGDWSPDGKWLAYTSDEAGQVEAFIRAHGADGKLGEPVQVSTGGATYVKWDPTESTLWYGTPQDKIMAVSIEIRSGGVRLSPPQFVWDLEKLHVAALDLLPSGKAIVVQKAPDEQELDLRRFDITLNFLEELKAKVGAGGR